MNIRFFAIHNMENISDLHQQKGELHFKTISLSERFHDIEQLMNLDHITVDEIFIENTDLALFSEEDLKNFLVKFKIEKMIFRIDGSGIFCLLNKLSPILN